MDFSVIVPVYNVKHSYLIECVQSILNQTYSNFELVLVDDGSTNGSGAVCDSYAARDGRIKVIHQANSGVSAARNAGINTAKGHWLLFCDADDKLQSNALELMHNDINANNCELFRYRYAHLLENGNIVPAPAFMPQQMISSDDLLRLILRHKVLGNCWAYTFRADIAKSIKFDTTLSIGEDTVFVVKYLLKSKGLIYNSNAVTYCYRNNQNGVTKNVTKLSEGTSHLNDYFRILLQDYHVLEKYFLEFNTYVIQNMMIIYLWQRKVPNTNDQKFLIQMGNKYIKSDINNVLLHYISILQKNRIIGNLLLHLPQFRNLTNSLRALRSKPPRMRFLLFKLAFCHVLTDMIV